MRKMSRFGFGLVSSTQWDPAAGWLSISSATDSPNLREIFKDISFDLEIDSKAAVVLLLAINV